MSRPTDSRAGLVALVLMLLLPLGARAEDSGSAAGKAIRFPGTLGLTGFMDMVDARTPGVLQFRTGARYTLQITDRDFNEGSIHLSTREEEHAFNSYLGVSFLGLIDVSARIPYLHEEERFNRRGIPEDEGDFDNGWGDLDLAAKITLEAGPFTVAPFVHGRLPTGEPAVEDLAELDFGSAVTFTLLNQYLSFHANISAAHEEEGITSLRYRLGVSFVAFATDDFLVRGFFYGDGIEFDGSGDSDIDLEFGAQGLLWGTITVELGFSVRVLNSGHVDNDLRRLIRAQQQPNAFISRRYTDDGSWGMVIGVGTVF